MHRRDLLLTALATAFAGPALAQAAKPTSPWWKHVEVLASDAFQGRNTGTPGYQKAADYVAAQFKAAGLKPAGENGTFFQTVAFETQTVSPDDSRVALTGEGGQALVVGEDLTLGARAPQVPEFDAPMVFLGYGIHLPEEGVDDFAGVDLKGKVAVVMRGGPSTLSGALRAYASRETQAAALLKAGAIGVISLISPKAQEAPWARTREAAYHTSMYLSEPALRTYDRPLFTAGMNPVHTEKLFAGSGHSFAEIVALADAEKPLTGFPLKLGVRASVKTTFGKTSAVNVVAVLPGADAALAGEAVVLSAHLDHLGVGKPDGQGGDGIFRGVMDNASGVASLLEIAAAMKRDPSKPKRSVVFLAVTGEEKGLVGSRYFAAHPTTHAGALVANINMDMYLPLFPLEYLVVYGAEESTLGDDAQAVAKAMGVTLMSDPRPEAFSFIRSDQYSFIRTGVPALAPKFAGPAGSTQAAIERDWRQKRYHGQADDLTQPVDIAAAERFNGFLIKLIRRVADAPTKPAWRADSFFRRFAKG